MQVIGNLYEHLKVAKEKSVNIVVATSGDTGSAAIAALNNRENIDKIIEWMLQRETNTKLIDLKLDSSHLRELWANCTTLGEITGTVFQQYSETRHKPRWGDKRPYYIRYISQLLKLYPDARIIHVIRNGHDCIASLKRMPWWKKNSIHSMLNCCLLYTSPSPRD